MEYKKRARPLNDKVKGPNGVRPLGRSLFAAYRNSELVVNALDSGRLIVCMSSDLLIAVDTPLKISGFPSWVAYPRP